MFPMMTPKVRLDAFDESILCGIQERKTLIEISKEVNRSHSGVKKRMLALEEAGYIQYNPHQARARMLTPKGHEYMQKNGLLKTYN